jgi:hypothetical protein
LAALSAHIVMDVILIIHEDKRDPIPARLDCSSASARKVISLKLHLTTMRSVNAIDLHSNGPRIFISQPISHFGEARRQIDFFSRGGKNRCERRKKGSWIIDERQSDFNNENIYRSDFISLPAFGLTLPPDGRANRIKRHFI